MLLTALSVMTTLPGYPSPVNFSHAPGVLVPSRFAVSGELPPFSAVTHFWLNMDFRCMPPDCGNVRENFSCGPTAHRLAIKAPVPPLPDAETTGPGIRIPTQPDVTWARAT